MRIYETMTLEDFLSANWIDLQPDLVRLLERTQRDLDEALADSEAWHDNYESLLDEATAFKNTILELACDTSEDVNARLDNIKEEIDHMNFELV